jgi:hypothetical protein
MLKLNEMQQKSELQTSIFNEYRHENSQKITGKLNSMTYQKDHTP